MKGSLHNTKQHKVEEGLERARRTASHTSGSTNESDGSYIIPTLVSSCEQPHTAESGITVFDVWKKSVLLCLVKAMQLIDKQERWLASELQIGLSSCDHFAHFTQIRCARAQLYPMVVGRQHTRNHSSDCGLPCAGRAVQNEARQTLGLTRHQLIQKSTCPHAADQSIMNEWAREVSCGSATRTHRLPSLALAPRTATAAPVARTLRVAPQRLALPIAEQRAAACASLEWEKA
jgi:hypothetical protein